jgi:hypothetical protein
MGFDKTSSPSVGCHNSDKELLRVLQRHKRLFDSRVAQGWELLRLFGFWPDQNATSRLTSCHFREGSEKVERKSLKKQERKN